MVLSCPKSVLYPCMFVARAAAEYIYKAHSLVFFYEPPERGRKVASPFFPREGFAVNWECIRCPC